MVFGHCLSLRRCLFWIAMSQHETAIQEIEEAIIAAKKMGSVATLKPLFELKAKLQGLFKDESGGENFIINLDLDHSQVCFLKEKIAKLESDLLATKTELEEYKKVFGGKPNRTDIQT
jgi:hypothetical protein